jgi:PleD family two-component response regulator
MPEMDGFELLAMMQDDDRLKDVPVVVMSANEGQEVIANSLKNGAKTFIVKPLRIQDCKGLV